MKKTVLIFGLISGAIISVMMIISMAFLDDIGFDRGEVVGYTSMVVAFLLVFFGIRSYRDNIAGGEVKFGRAFAVGALIVAVSSLCYVATWEVIYFRLMPDFGAKYQAHMMEKARASGASEAALAQKKAEMDELVVLYRNPAINASIPFLEPLPVGLIIALVSAGVLSRRRKRDVTELGPVSRAGVSS